MLGNLTHPRMPDVVLFHRISGLPRASFRFRLATDTLVSGYALGATSCARDFHPLERAHAGRTQNPPPLDVAELLTVWLMTVVFFFTTVVRFGA